MLPGLSSRTHYRCQRQSRNTALSECKDSRNHGKGKIFQWLSILITKNGISEFIIRISLSSLFLVSFCMRKPWYTWDKRNWIYIWQYLLLHTTFYLRESSTIDKWFLQNKFSCHICQLPASNKLLIHRGLVELLNMTAN